jgi:hypothetical protein
MALILPYDAVDSFWGIKSYCSYAMHHMWLDIASGVVGGQQPRDASYPGTVLTMRREPEV